MKGKSAEQVRRQWYRLWDCYKACWGHVEHTGGGDGDMENAISSVDSGDENLQGELVGDEGLVKKRQKTRSKERSKTCGQYSHKVMDVFETSKLYRMIDDV